MIDGRLIRKIAAVTALKLIGLCVLYFLFFGPAHRLPVDPDARIAGLPPATSLDSTPLNDLR